MCGPYPKIGIHGERGVLIVVDDNIKSCYVALLKDKAYAKHKMFAIIN